MGGTGGERHRDDARLRWARELQAVAQAGLHYTDSPYERERYGQVARIAAEMLAAQADLPVAEILRLNASDIGYATPKVDVRGVVFRDNRILLVRETQDGGRWTLPGGWADVNDTPSSAVEREIREESGYEARAVKVLAVYDREAQGHRPPYARSIYKIFFLCELTGGEARTSHETGGAEFFAEDATPELSEARVLAKQIHRFFEHLRNPSLPADFD